MKIFANDMCINGPDAVRHAIQSFGNAPDVEIVRTWAINTVNRLAGDARTRIGTDIPFQGDVYQLKQAEAIAFQSDDAPDATKYPVTYAEAAARGMEPSELVAEYLANAAAWPQVLAAIEAVRMGTITAIGAATDIDGIEAALAAITWPV